MGVSASTEIPPAFDDVKSWPWSRVISVVKAYNDGEYDFGIDYPIVMAITGMTMEEAQAMIQAHTKSDSGIVNAVTFLISLISLADSNRRNENLRLTTIFDLLDFNKASQISKDELTILLLCVASSYSFILKKTQDAPSDVRMSKWSVAIYEKLGKKQNHSITKDEFQAWASENLWKQGVYNINAVSDLLSFDPADLAPIEEAA